MYLEDLKSNNEIAISSDQQALLEEFERKRKAQSIYVPTDDTKVRLKLRELGEPICLFGERPAERRDRLRELLFSQPESMDVDEESEEEEEEDDNEDFYTLGSEELVQARRKIALASLSRAQRRLSLQNEEVGVPIAQRRRERHQLYSELKTFSTLSSQFGDERPLSFCCFSPNSKAIATGSWGGGLKLWNVPDSQVMSTFRGHKDRISGIAFPEDPSVKQMASASADGAVLLWNMDRFNSQGHEMRATCRYHPLGQYLGTASFDGTWRLWDVETQTELLLQEGHSSELYGFCFQCDGSLAVSGGSDNIARVWDLRSGKSIMVLQGHTKGILSLDWSPNGYQLASGSQDNTIRIWDIRHPGSSAHIIPAHSNLVSQVRYFRGPEAQNFAGCFLVSASYDGTCKIFTQGDWKCIKSISGLEGKIMSCDVSSDGRFIATAAYDKTFKLHASENIQLHT